MSDASTTCPDADTIKLPDIFVNVFTSRPLFGDIDAVTEPLAILKASPDKDENGMFDNPSPLPEK